MKTLMDLFVISQYEGPRDDMGSRYAFLTFDELDNSAILWFSPVNIGNVITNGDFDVEFPTIIDSLLSQLS